MGEVRTGRVHWPGTCAQLPWDTELKGELWNTELGEELCLCFLKQMALLVSVVVS